jgi:3-oxoacyl-[acyl-carrier-protein] synthase III
MRIEPLISITGLGLVVPDTRQPVEVAVRAGLVSRSEIDDVEIREVHVAADGASPGQAAAEAARRALDMARRDVSSVASVFYAWVVDTPGDWKRAPRLARELGAVHAVAAGVRQMSNGSGMGLDLAVARLAMGHPGPALVVTSDALPPDSPRRWQHKGLGGVFSDSATALVVDRGPGPLRVRALATHGAPDQEAQCPPDNPLTTPAPADWIQRAQTQEVTGLRMRKAVRACVREVLADCAVKPSCVLLPRVAPSLRRALTDGLLPGLPQVRTSATGHLYAGDLPANLLDLLASGCLADGEHALVINVGGGFAVTCVIVERTASERPL